MSGALIPGEMFGRYRVVQQIGRGGMGVVYEVHNTDLDRHEALKLLLRADAPEAERRFLREARIAAGLSHPGIVTAYHYGITDGTRFLSMALVAGADLAAVVDGSGLPLPSNLPWIDEIAEALDYAHARGVVHRDIKPSNILIGDDGHARLTDFGVSRTATVTDLTATGAILGTLDYLSPEQAAGGTPGPAADQYGLACTVYHVLAGRPPFAGAAAAVLGQHLQVVPRPITEHRPELDQTARVLARALEKRPDRRFPDCAAFAAALRTAAAHDDLGRGGRVPTAVGSPWTGNCETGNGEIGGEETVLAAAAENPELRTVPAILGGPLPSVSPRPVDFVDYSDFQNTERNLPALRWLAGCAAVAVLVLLIFLI